MYQRGHHNTTPKSNKIIDIKNKPECQHKTEVENKQLKKEKKRERYL